MELTVKRFYRAVTVASGDDGCMVLLDGREVRSPAGAGLVLPNRALAAAVAEEWRDQADAVAPHTMPLMSLAATAVDRVAPRRREVVEAIAGYGRSDLLCHRADGPGELVRKQQEVWQPLLDWLESHVGAALAVTTGVMPHPQSREAIAAIRSAVAGLGDFELTALHEMVAAAGSVVIGLAVAEGRLSGEDGVSAAQLDEVWQAGRWGEDDEARNRRDGVRRDLLAAERFLRLCRSWN